MSHVKCSQCGESVRWSAKRGSRLRDTPCPYCGGTLQGRVVPCPTKGHKFGLCVVCGKKRLHGRPCWYHDKADVAAAIAAAQVKGGVA